MSRSFMRKLAFAMVIFMAFSMVQVPAGGNVFVSEAFAENLPENAQENAVYEAGGQTELAKEGTVLNPAAEIPTEKSAETEPAANGQAEKDVVTEETSNGVAEKSAASEKEKLKDRPLLPFSAEEVFDNAVVRVEADPGVFPEGAYMTAAPITGGLLSEMKEAVLRADYDPGEKSDDIFSRKESDVRLFDITIHDRDGREIQPDKSKGSVRVSITPPKMEEGEPGSQKLFCLEDNGEVSFLNAKEGEDGALAAEAEHFSIYGVMNIFVKASDPIIADRSDTIPYILGYNIVNRGDAWLDGFDTTVDGTVYTFEHGRDYVGFDHGVVLDTSGRKPGSKDPELENLLNTVTPGARYGGDTSSITISKTITKVDPPNPLSFRYVFASSEFDQEEKYNDIIGVFYRKNNGSWQCVSKLPNERFITIKNLRAGDSGNEMDSGRSTLLNSLMSHSYFKVKNIGDGNNGFTTNGVSGMITNGIPVRKGDKIEVKFVIADVADTDRDSYLFIEENSFTVGHVQNRVDYYDSNGDRIFYQKYNEGSKFQVCPLPASFDPGGRRFLGWKDYDGFTTTNSSKIYQPEEWSEKVTDKAVRMIAQFEPVKSTVRIKLTRDGKPWTGYDKLYLINDSHKVYLTESETSGTYVASDVLCGQYSLRMFEGRPDLWEGRLGIITINDSGGVEGKMQYDFKTLHFTTMLDGKPEDIIWTNEQYNYLVNNRNSYYLWDIFRTGTGTYVRPVPDDTGGGDYRIVINGKLTGKTMEEDGNSAVVDYTTLRVTIHNDTKWTKATLKLKDASGKEVSRLEYNGNAHTDTETDAVYEARFLVDEDAGPYNLYIGDVDTGITMKPTLDPDDSKKELTFYTATFTVNGLAEKLPLVTIDNGIEQKVLTTSDSTYPYHYSASGVYKRVKNGEELPYRISAKELSDIDPDTDVITSTARERVVTYHTVTYHRYNINTSSSAECFTPYVRHGKVISPYGLLNLKGYTSLGWTTNEWTPDTSVDPIFFDFSNPINEDMSLYVWYDKPEVKINGIVQCDENGNLGATGWYRMPNASITGFDPGARAVRFLQVDTNNATQIKITNAGDITTNPAGSTSGTTTTISGKSVTIDFGENANISMAQAQSFLRNNVLVKPATGAEHTVTVTARDSDAAFINPVYSTPAVATAEGTTLTGSSSLTTLNSGKYFVTGSSGSTAIQYTKGLAVASGATVYLYVKHNADGTKMDIQIKGEDATSTEAGKAGIRLPNNSKLIIYGSGRVNCTPGGNTSDAHKTNLWSGGAGIGADGCKPGEAGATMGTLYVETSTERSVFANGAMRALYTATSHYSACIGGGKGGGSAANGGPGAAYEKTSGLIGMNGSPNASGIQVTPQVYPSNITTMRPSYNIKYLDADGTEITDFKQTYYHGKVGGTTVTIPAYTPTDGSNFLGWQLVQYAQANTETQAVTSLTSAPTKAQCEASAANLIRPDDNKIYTIPEASYGEIILRAVTEKISGVSAEDDDNRNFPGTPVADEIHTYRVKVIVDDVVDKNRGTIKIGDQNVTADGNGVYTLYTTETSPESKDIFIGGSTYRVGSVAPGDGTEDPTEIEYETIKVTVSGNKPNRVSLKYTSGGELTDGPALNEEAYDEEPEDGYLWHCERLKSNDGTGPFHVYVDGEDTGKPVSYGGSVTINYYTLTAKVTPVGAETNDISTLELRRSGEDNLFFTKQDDEGSGETVKAVFTVTGLDKGKSYKVYINGEATGKTAKLNDGVISLTYTRYTTTVVTAIDGEPAIIGEVRLGSDTMIQTSDGKYTLTLSNNVARDLYVGEVKVKGDVTPGGNETVEYFTVSYNKSGKPEYAETETGELPIDGNCYLKGTKATLMGSSDLKNGAMTFDGWTIEGETQPRAIGAEVTVNKKIKAYATWSGTSLKDSSTEVTVEDNWFVYNGESQKPTVTVSRNGKALTEGEHYELSYMNTNGGEDNTTNAGDITITVKGIGDYKGSFDRDPLSNRLLTYTIHPKDLRLTVSGNDKEYDGTTDIVLSNMGALSGVIDSDTSNVIIETGSSGKLKTSDVGEDLPVTVDMSNLKGSASSNYSLRPADPIRVNVTKRTLSSDMFEVEDQLYTGEPLTPELKLKDIKNDNVGNILKNSDFIADYSNNREMGKATVTVTATESGNYQGSVELHFSIAKGTIKGYTPPTKKTMTYTGREQELINRGSTPRGTMKYSLSSDGPWEETVPTKRNIGSYDVYWKIEGGDNYNDVACQGLSGNLIEPREVELKWENTTLKYNGTPQSPSARAGNVADGDTCTVTVSVNVPHIDAGDYTVEATELSNDNYKLPDNKTYNYTILPNDDLKESTLTDTQRVKANKPTYDGHEHKLVSGPNAIPDNYEGVYYRIAEGDETDTPWGNTIPVGTYGGKYNVQVKYKAANTNYADLIIDLAAPIKPAPFTVKGKPCTIIYGETPSNNGVSLNGFVNGEDESVLGGSLDYDYSYKMYDGAGNYKITPKGLTSGNYDIRYVPGTLTVLPKAIGFTWGDTTLAYNGKEQAPEVLLDGLLNEDEVEAEVSGKEKDCGENYTAKITGLTGKKAGSYTLSGNNLETTFKIVKGKAEAKVRVHEKLTYNGTEQSLIAEGKAVGGTLYYAVTMTDKAPELSALSTEIPKGKDTGTYYVWYKVKGDKNHHDSDMGMGICVISGNSKSITISADGVDYTLTYTDSIIYDGRIHMAYPEGKAVKNTKRKAFDLKIVITDGDGKAIDQKLIKVRARVKKSRNAGTGEYKVRVKGKKYKALNKILKSPEYKKKFTFTIEQRILSADSVSVKLNKKETKVRRVTITDSDGYAHRLKKKDYTVESINPETRTVVISGKKNTKGEITLNY